MAGNLLASFAARGFAGMTRVGKRKLYKGKTRTMIRHVLATLNALRRRDDRELGNSVQKGYTPTLVTRGPTQADQNAFTKVITRLADALRAKEGDE